MCGRYVSTSTPDEIAQHFDAVNELERALEPSWNVAPTDDVYVVREDDDQGRVVAAHHWGLVPIWAKSPAIGSRMINARSEGLADKNPTKHAFRRRRCLVPADGFYEWRKLADGKTKQPFFIQRADGQPLAFAGLWEEWRGPDRERADGLRSATIVTTTPNELMATLHDRMPVILEPGTWDEWLDPANRDVDGLEHLLAPADDGVLVAHPVGPAVGNVRNQGPQLIEPVEAIEQVEAQQLF